MAIEDFDIGVYWGGRREGIEECTRRLEAHFSALASTSDQLAQWFNKAPRKPKVPDPVDVRSPAELAQLLQRGVNRKDVGREAMPELGFTISLWNGARGGWSSSTDIKCGLYAEVRGLSNFAHVSVKGQNEQPLRPADFVPLLKKLIEVWNPDWGKIATSRLEPTEGTDDTEWREYFFARYWTDTNKAAASDDGRVEVYERGHLWIPRDEPQL